MNLQLNISSASLGNLYDAIFINEETRKETIMEIGEAEMHPADISRALVEEYQCDVRYEIGGSPKYLLFLFGDKPWQPKSETKHDD